MLTGSFVYLGIGNWPLGLCDFVILFIILLYMVVRVIFEAVYHDFFLLKDELKTKNESIVVLLSN